MVAGSFKLIRLFGIDIRVHPSWLIVFALVTWSLSAGYFPNVVPGLGEDAAWFLAVIAALLFFASVLAHELSHSLVARSRGLGVHSITLFIFGGVSSLTGDARTPGTEFVVAIVGPATSLAIAAACFGANSVLDQSTGLAAVLGYLGLVNGLVGVFNLIPGFPLDGGRVLRSIVWRITGNVRRATRIAAGTGQAVAFLLMFWGIFQVFSGHLFNGLWSVAIGWFLQSAASSSVEQLSLDDALGDLRVRDVFRREIVTVAPTDSIEDVVTSVFMPRHVDSVAVADGRVLGVATVNDVARVPPHKRATTPISAVMSASNRLVPIGPDDTLRDAAEALEATEFELLPVVESGRLVGLLTKADLLRALQLRANLRAAG